MPKEINRGSGSISPDYQSRVLIDLQEREFAVDHDGHKKAKAPTIYSLIDLSTSQNLE
jgi:hypothetical protein